MSSLGCVCVCMCVSVWDLKDVFSGVCIFVVSAHECMCAVIGITNFCGIEPHSLPPCWPVEGALTPRLSGALPRCGVLGLLALRSLHWELGGAEPLSRRWICILSCTGAGIKAQGLNVFHTLWVEIKREGKRDRERKREGIISNM